MATESHSPRPAVQALRRTAGWTLVDRRGLDHVIVTPATVLAVQRVDGRDDLRGRWRVRAAARALASYLDTCNLHATVTPVLMRTGSDVPQWVEGFRRGHGVYVVDGDRAYLWRHRFAAPVLAADVRRRIVAALELRPHEDSADLDPPVVAQARHPGGVVTQ